MSVCYFISLEKGLFLFVINFSSRLGKIRNKEPIHTDGAHWYNHACKWLRLKHRVYGTEMKNMIERFIQQIKDRTECLMIIFHATKKNVKDSMSTIGLKCLYYIYL